jgi:hypothetical protein
LLLEPTEKEEGIRNRKKAEREETKTRRRYV